MEITKRVLSNGFKLISHNQPSHCASIGVFINAGTRHDIQPGTAHFLSKMAFSSTADYPSSELQHAIESIGGNVSCQTGLESIHYTASLFKHDIPRALTLLSSIITKPLFTPSDVDLTRKTIAYEQESISDTPEALTEKFLALAYNNETLGKSVRETDVSSESLHMYRAMHYTPDNISISAAGVDAGYLAHHVEDCFKMAPSITTTAHRALQHAPAIYTGGVSITDTTPLPLKNPDTPKLTHLYIGFESLSMSDPDIYSLAVLASLLGGGGSFSAGGPGKGMYTRLYRNLLNKHYWIENANHFNHTYHDSGVFGIACSILPGKETHAAVGHVICEQFMKCTQKIGEEELSRAKNMLKSMILMGGESQVTQAQDMGRQYLMFGGMVSETQSCERIDEVEGDDIRRVARRVMFGTDEVSRFEYNDGIMHGYKRTGRDVPTVLVSGPMQKNDALYKIMDVLGSWGLSTSPKKRGSPSKML